jgi:carboxypeptidase PM20D1
MRKLIRRIVQLFIVALLIIIGIVVIKTITFTSKQVEVAPIVPKNFKQEAKMIERLSRAIQYPTISLPNAIDTAAFTGLAALMKSEFTLVDSLLDFQAVNGFSHVYKWAGKNARLSPVLLTAHLDVVPVDESSIDEWQHPPFSGADSSGFIWGRGTLDDKLAAFGILEAVEQLLKEQYIPERTIYIAFGHDEEVSGINGAQKIADYFEEQGIFFEFVMDEGMLIVEDALDGLSQPVAIVGVAEKGYATLTLTAQLKDAGHSSMPPSETAVGLLGKAIYRLETNPFPPSIEGPLAQFFNYVGPEMSLPYKAVFANLWLTEKVLHEQLGKKASTNASIRTTVAPTMLRAGFKENVLPTRASAKVNFRILPGETVESVKAHVRELVDDEHIIVSVSPEAHLFEPSEVSATEAFGFEVIQHTIHEVFPGVIVAPGLMIGGTDGKHYQKVSNNVYRFLPMQLTNEDLKRLHGINERVDKEAYLQLIQFYYRLLENSCK